MRRLDTLQKQALSIIIVGCVLALFCGVALYFALGYFTPKTPVTYKEAQVIVGRDRYAESKDIQTWYSYVSQLIQAKQFQEAQSQIASAIGSSLQSKDSYDNYILSAQAELEFAQGKYEKAYESAKLAQKAMMAAYKEEYKSLDMPNRAKSLGISDNYYGLYLLEAGAQKALGDTAAEEEALRAYLKQNPTEGGVWVDLGDCLARQNQTDAAKDAYNQALEYLPDYKPALTGLRKLQK